MHESAMKKREPASEAKHIQLVDCLLAWSAAEKLSPKDPWYCPSCKDHREATKKLDLFKLPKILVIHLKRFSHANRIYREKIDALVDFPIVGLDLTSIALGAQQEPPVYDLFAVSNHMGGLGKKEGKKKGNCIKGGGHYTAYAKNYTNGKWYVFDDSSTSEIKAESVKTSSAYVLFYRRRDASNL